MSRLTRYGTAESVSRDQIFRREWGQGNVHFPCSADHEQDWQPYPVDPYSCYICVCVCVCVCVYLLNCTPTRLQTALAVMGFKLNPDAVKFFPVSGHRRGKRADWRWMSVSKLQIRYAGGDERCGRRRVRLLNPLSGDTHKQDMYMDGWTKSKVGNGRFDLVWFRLSCDYG